MNDLIEIKEVKDQLYTTSLDIAEKFGKEHKNVLQTIQGLECSEIFNQLNFKPIEYLDDRNRKQPAYLITKDGAIYLIMGFTGSEAAQWKEKYIEAFNKMYTELSKRRGLDWNKTRVTSKSIRQEQTDIIKLFVEYAMGQGSQSANKYYMSLSQMEKTALGYLKLATNSDIPFRSTLASLELGSFMIADRLVSRALLDGMGDGLYYKDIYKLAKERVYNFTNSIGQGRIEIEGHKFLEQRKEKTQIE